MTVDGREERIKAHQYFAGVWASLAKEGMDQIEKQFGSNHDTRERLEKFVQRCASRALRHYREAERTRKRAIG